MHKPIVHVLVALALASTGCAHRLERGVLARHSGAEIDEARAFVDSMRLAQSLPGVGVTVVQAGRPVWSEGLGVADREHAVAATPATKFRVGSVSKLFTAAALMRLVDAGLLDLDTPIRKYLPRYPSTLPDVTLRQLAGHTSGIRHYRGVEFLSTAEYASLSDAIGIFIGDTLLFPPGSRYSYSSYGYNLIGAVIETVTGEPFPTMVDRLVFTPLGMLNTVPDSSGRIILGRAALYRVAADGNVTTAPSDNLSSRWPSGGYLSTTQDLAQFGVGVRRPGFLTAKSLSLMFAPQRLSTGSTTQVGIGWRIATDSAGRVYYHHGGSSNGGAAFLLVYPIQETVVAMGSNALGSWSAPEARRVAAFFLR
ncbi:MAG: serine hydrolase domain-containing protein [Gemmatimonadaceae bacterium]